MPKRINRAKSVSAIERALICPLCESRVRVVDFKTLICSRNNTFDFTKQGYLHLIPHPSNSHYGKEFSRFRYFNWNKQRSKNWR
ncbi:putative RNA methyltransferase [Metabacillus idriensis]|uniref:putative RNA methyltransferase n=1 Tax=Metabacillus idriensis TaxID=324768 RepID=UPI0039901AC0